MRAITIFLLCITTACHVAAQPAFIGLTESVKAKTDIIFRDSNYGSIRVKDTVMVLDVTGYHLFRVEKIARDSMDVKNFIGGDYEDDKGSLVYFNQRMTAKYLTTIFYENYALTREIGEFFSSSKFFLCVRFPQRTWRVTNSRDDELEVNGIKYTFDNNGIAKKGSSETTKLLNFYRAEIVSRHPGTLIVLSDRIGKEEYIRIFFNRKLLAGILVSLERN